MNIFPKKRFFFYSHFK
jgi:hypothetical protein